MSTNPKKTGPFDVKTVEALAALMSEHDLNEITLREGDAQLRLRRGIAAQVLSGAPMASATPAPAAAAKTSTADSTAEVAPARKNLVEIKSETVGTFYSQPKPGEPAYVKLGDRITPTKVVGLVEVMKTYNELQAGCSGTVVEILVKDSQAVEFGQVLFRVDPS